MKRRIAALMVVGAAFAAPTAGAHLDHPMTTIAPSDTPLSTEVNSGGPGATWDLLATIPTANPQSDLDFFTQDGKTFASVGMLGSSVNGGGQMIVELMDGSGTVDPKYVSNHPSASCVSDPNAALGLQHDVEATPKGDVILNTKFDKANRSNAQLLIDATDAAGRCHDQGLGGLAGSPPRGGLELIDITDINNPKEIGLTSHIGQAHTVNVDPRRPHIAYAVSSDAVNVSGSKPRTRANETTATNANLDGFEVVDMRSCLEAPLGTVPPGYTIEQKRALCRPEVYRYRWPSAEIALGHTNQGRIYGCHELEVYPDDRLTCGSGPALIVFDMSGAFDDNGTPDDFTDDKPRGTPLPCNVRDTTTQLAYLKTGAKVTDCVTGAGGADLRVKNWKENLGSPSLEGVEHVGSVFHMGREFTDTAFTPAYPPTEDIDFDHEGEFTQSRKYLIATDERGGGVTGGAQCDNVDATGGFANGGVHVYRSDRLQKETPEGALATDRAQAAFQAYAQDSEGGKSIYRAPVRTEPKGSMCTAHVMQQIPGQNRIFMGWYTQGTQVIDIYENKDGTVDLREAGWFIPENANQWVSAIFKVENNRDGTFTYYGATGDGIVGDAGRNGMDVYKVTLPAPPKPRKADSPASDDSLIDLPGQP
jgi:hypothetical protein